MLQETCDNFRNGKRVGRVRREKIENRFVIPRPFIENRCIAQRNDDNGIKNKRIRMKSYSASLQGAQISRFAIAPLFKPTAPEWPSFNWSSDRSLPIDPWVIPGGLFATFDEVEASPLLASMIIDKVLKNGVWASGDPSFVIPGQEWKERSRKLFPIDWSESTKSIITVKNQKALSQYHKEAGNAKEKSEYQIEQTVNP